MYFNIFQIPMKLNTAAICIYKYFTTHFCSACYALIVLTVLLKHEIFMTARIHSR
jgi:hypothetical protein